METKGGNMAYEIQHMTPVLFGIDTAKQTGERLKRFGCQKVLCVYDQGIKKAGIADQVIESIKTAGIDVIVYEGVQADPPDYTIDEGAVIGRKELVDGVVGIGGGSSMDTAKAVNVMLTNSGSIRDLMIMKPGNAPRLPKPGKTLVLLPTTSGTGSEVTAVAVLTDSKAHDKKGIGGPTTRATLAIVDPTLTVGMPPSVTADTGMDVFAHAIEAITANRANQMSDVMGENAIKLLWKYLPIAMKDGKNIEARSNMSFAAMAAGYAFQDSMTHLAHAVGHTLGSMYHIPHGNACGVCLGEISEYIADTVPDGIKLIANAMGLKTNGTPAAIGKEIKDTIREFSDLLGQKKLSQMNIPESDLDKIAEVCAGSMLTTLSPKKLTKIDALNVIREAYTR
jgi:alcohol dehydrogenase